MMTSAFYFYYGYYVCEPISLVTHSWWYEDPYLFFNTLEHQCISSYSLRSVLEPYSALLAGNDL